MTQAFGPAAEDDRGPLPDTGHDPLPAAPGIFAPDLGAANGSPLDELRGAVTAEIAPNIETYEVPTRPGWTIQYSAGIDGPKIDQWVNAATPSKGPNRKKFDQTKWGALVLGSQCVAILKDGQNPTEEDKPVTFRDESFLALLGAQGVADGVRAFYGGAKHIGDGHIVAQAYDLLKAAGYDENGVRRVDTDAPEGLDEQGPTER